MIEDVQRRSFRAFIFDWDGTAVPDRVSAVPELVETLNAALEQGFLCAIITGTKLEAIDAQCTRFLSPRAKAGLHVCTNRGSEVYAFSKSGAPVLRYRRTALEAEDQALTRVALACRDKLAGRGLETAIISGRLNRRKLDLIPVPRWNEPKKAELADLLRDVRERIAAAGFAGSGLPGIVALASDTARELGLREAKVTTDIKHVEIGLTDKSDSVRWLLDNVLRPLDISPRAVAIVGDEFGRLGGIPGSDALMMIPGLEQAAFLSVGVEPEGVPAGVERLGGGPRRFTELLGQQLAQRPAPPPSMPIATADPAWLIEQDGFDPSRERELESIFSLGNGYLGVRSSSDLPLPSSQGDLFIAGIYSKKIVTLPYSESRFITTAERDDPFSELVTFPFPFRLALWLDGRRLELASPSLKSYVRLLDLAKGLLFSTASFDDADGRRTTLRTLRCASLDDPHLLLQEVELTCENHSGPLELDLSMSESDFHLNHPHLNVLALENTGRPTELFGFETQASSYKVCVASQVFEGSHAASSARLRLQARAEEPVRIRKLVTVHTSRDGSEPFEQARRGLLSRESADFEPLLAAHGRRWRELWHRSDIEFEKDPALTQAQRFNIYQLSIAAERQPELPPNSSIGARTLTGRAYEGHVFWDVETFMFPFYLYTQPEIARRLLLYRHETLPAARNRAARQGLRGASFAWESTVTGEDVTPRLIVIRDSDVTVPIRTGSLQIHVTADIAHAVWQYWDATQDEGFLLGPGAELLVETARFWESRAARDGRLAHFADVIGPDEYHVGVTDNAYTNWMARLNLERAAEACEWMQAERPRSFEELRSRIALEPAEPVRWRELERSIFIPAPNKQGVIEQFREFFSLDDAPIDAAERLRPPISRLLRWRELNRQKIIKQADVLMIPFLFPRALPPEVVRACYLYYEPRTDHGSSLSLAVHAAIAARAGLEAEAERYWRSSLFLDLKDLMSNTAMGIHAGCMGATWQALVFHLLGVELANGAVSTSGLARPDLPRFCRDVRLKLFYRGKELSL